MEIVVNQTSRLNVFSVKADDRPRRFVTLRPSEMDCASPEDLAADRYARLPETRLPMKMCHGFWRSGPGRRTYAYIDRIPPDGIHDVIPFGPVRELDDDRMRDFRRNLQRKD